MENTKNGFATNSPDSTSMCLGTETVWTYSRPFPAQPQSDPAGAGVDNVNHPAHYADSCSIECIDAMMVAMGRRAVMDFCQCNAFKYLWRHKHKNGVEDVKKAGWYLLKCEALARETEEGGGEYKDILENTAELFRLFEKTLSTYMDKDALAEYIEAERAAMN